jgi:anti-sigma B factor antagonist
MMTFNLGESTNAVRKAQRLDKIPRGENTLKALNALAVYQRPVWDLRLQLLNVRLGDEWGVAAARGTLFNRESTDTHPPLDAQGKTVRPAAISNVSSQCPICGNPMPDDPFCAHCGFPLNLPDGFIARSISGSLPSATFSSRTSQTSQLCRQVQIIPVQLCFRATLSAALASYRTRRFPMAADPVIPFPSLTLDTQKSGETATVLCHGKVVTNTAATLQNEVRRLIPQFKTIVLDLTDVSYMDSSGLGALVGLYVSAKRAGKQLKLINLSDRVRDMLRITNLLSVFEGYGEYL